MNHVRVTICSVHDRCKKLQITYVANTNYLFSNYLISSINLARSHKPIRAPSGIESTNPIARMRLRSSTRTIRACLYKCPESSRIRRRAPLQAPPDSMLIICEGSKLGFWVVALCVEVERPAPESQGLGGLG